MQSPAPIRPEPAAPLESDASFDVPHQRLALVALLAAAFLVRLLVRLAFGPAYFWINGYIVYYALAQNVASGKGFCMAHSCAYLPPLYPLFLSLSVLAGKSFLLVVVPQALMGAGTALCAYCIARQLFNPLAGLIACAATAFYPYYVMHDTALQDTGMATFGTVLSVWLLLRAGVLQRKRNWLFAGLGFGATALVRAPLAPNAGAALLWCAIWEASGNAGSRLRNSLILLAGILIATGPWLAMTYWTTGRPVLTSQTGSELWKANNPETFSHYPLQSIDLSAREAFSKLSPADRAELGRLAGNEIATSDWFTRRALEFIRTHPSEVLRRALRKLEAGFSWQLNPLREPLVEVVNAVAYVPVAVLGLLGMLLAWRTREVKLIALLYLAFMAVTAVFWAHTSHRSYLDVYWIVFAASVVERAWRRARSGLRRQADRAPDVVEPAR